MPSLTIDNYQLVPIRQEDVESIRLWRNAQIDILRQNKPITSDEQQSYFEKVIWPLFKEKHPKQLLFSFLFDGICIGYGGLTNIDWEMRRAEISFLVNPERITVTDPSQYRSDFTHFLKLICQLAFNTLHLHRLYTETFAFRKSHIAILESCGFKHEGILREHIYKKNSWFDSIMHGLLAKEFHAK